MYDEVYNDTVFDHFMNPRNAGVINDADGFGVCGDPGCGDFLTIYIKVANDTIADISFLVFGCAAAIATSSMTTELAKGKTLEEAIKITEDDIIEALGGLPEHKQHCSNLGVKALRSAIENYYNKTIEKYQ
ncbi:NifU-like protein [Pelotomaculum sp. FP]|uniref:iron-sulfur cluster assembly scaffold protein n=1 Tax=Pelotomaculum sp. FP TaxID=261474 RepID=UPI00106601E8|nr:iron-sulfur cluster assembly scaffold protein [Pelotomaculum sp. FP]TEB10750.1 NifU-like protein [Pelotomaculum sp. FP]